jgi:hypothetical protein
MRLLVIWSEGWTPRKHGRLGQWGKSTLPYATRDTPSFSFCYARSNRIETAERRGNWGNMSGYEAGAAEKYVYAGSRRRRKWVFRGPELS